MTYRELISLIEQSCDNNELDEDIVIQVANTKDYYSGNISIEPIVKEDSIDLTTNKIVIE